MSNNTIDAKTLSRCFLAGAKALEAKKAYINELNVFPVPDGDTGTNMTLTIMSAARDVLALSDIKMDNLAKAMSSGSLRGARGNSGVILSQLIRGFTKVVKSEEEIDTVVLANAMQKATESAYKAVMKPKEGTILTVAKAAADKASELVQTEEDMSSFIEQIIAHAEDVLKQTPEMLPVLKQAGVVDSGGHGLVELMKGAYDCYLGKEVDLSFGEEEQKDEEKEQKEPLIRYRYSIRYLVNTNDVFNSKNDEDYKTYLDSLGERTGYSVKSTGEGNLITVALNTNDPGLALQKGLDYGVCYEIVIENLKPVQKPETLKTGDNGSETVKEADKETGKEESKENGKGSESEKEANEAPSDDKSEKKEIPKITLPENKEPRKMGFVAVTVGEGMENIFKGLGVDEIISGGQTMNPSTEDMLSAIDKINAENVFILPNNKNIIMAADQAKYLVEDKNIIVIPTKTVPQGITALINYSPEASVEENTEAMNEEIKKVKTGQVTYAVRDTVISDMEIKQGNIMGIGDHDILSVGVDVEKTALEMLEKMIDDSSELISIYYGIEVDEEAAGDLLAQVEEKFPDLDAELHFGGQPIYYYVISVE
ncbi:MAG: DAK2 domain-containing protein [Lachnospiraceae bacterium]|nr:DAK2 domain-containing protein [Lachnospiraceae bacterium]